MTPHKPAAQDDISQTVGAAVRSARARSGLSRKRLAIAAHVSERYLNQLEHGQANVSIGVLDRVASALAVDIGSLLPAAMNGGAGLNGNGHGRGHGNGQANGANGIPDGFARLIAAMSPREQNGALELLERYVGELAGSLHGIALLGMRGAGKTTIGSLFAKKHGLPFLSVTREIETRAGTTLAELFSRGGTQAYRKFETDVIRDLSQRDGHIILETAGGVVGNPDSANLVFNSFRTVWLKAAPEDHFQRVVRQGDSRLARGQGVMLDRLKTLLAERERDYARADHVLVTSGREPAACVEELDRIAAPIIG